MTVNPPHSSEAYPLKSPVWISSTVVPGFARGGKELGTPTANLDESTVNSLDPQLKNGIYFGFARVSNGPVYPMVMSTGWNPFYKNVKRSAEIHIIHQFKEDFYDENIQAVVLGYIRSERDYESINDLKKDIQNDIAYSMEMLAQPKNLTFSTEEQFNKNIS